MKKILLFCSTLFLFFAVYGQGHIYPVQANVNVVAPYSLYLSDYVSGSKERLIVTLLNRDVQYPSMPVRLRLSIKGNGFSIQTRPYASVSPITLEPNVPYKLTVDDLMPYFDTRNLLAQGLGGDSYLKGGRLPEGMIEFGIEVLEYGTSKVLSQRAIGTAWLALQKPPLLSLPFQDEVIPWREPLNLLFQWTPQHSGVARVEYELIIKELWDNGLAPESAFAWSPEIFRERITSTSYLYGTLAPALEPGRRYAWAVRVVAKDGADDVSIFENEGLSMIRSFRIARYCPEPVQVKATAERGYIHVEWESAPEHIDYTVAYRVKGAETWAEVRSTFPSALLSGVRPGYTYEYRVGGFCEPLVPTFGKTAFLTLPSEDTTRLRNCGMLRPVDLSNQDPLDELLNGDQFIAGDFPVHVQEVTGSQGFFTGNGYVHVPFLAYAPFKVTFDNVYINTDRRMIRGVVKTVYDPTESGMGNMDDIFTGGGHTGNVVEGITKTDLSADFVIDKDSGFFFDETTGKIEVTDASGQVIGYIETGHSVPGGGEPGGNNGNAPSVFPMTVKDSEGNIYEVEEAPEDGSGTENEGAGENPGSGSKKQLVVTPVGKSGDGLNQDEVNFKRLDSRMAEVVFTDTEGSLYAFDAWKAVYSGSYLIRTKYEQLGESYRVPAKLIPSGKKDKVGAVITVHDPSVDPDKVIFKTRSGTEFKREKFDKTTGRYVLNLVGGNANDGQELYALYPKPGGGYYNLGKLLIVSYPSYRIKVKIVPVANDLDEFEALRGELEKIYSRVGIECVVEKMPVFAYSSPLLFADKSGVFSAYTDEMKKLQGAYVENYGIDPEASYLFVLLYSGQGDDRNYTGFMPLNKQFGYLFRRDFGSFEEFAVAAAHELAHGRLSLRHPFDKSLGLPEGSVADNLMDYRHGRELAKWQWDVIHDPGIVLRVFERDEDAAIVDRTMEAGDLAKGENIGLDPSGKVIFKVEPLQSGAKVVFLIKKDMPYIYGFRIYTDKDGDEKILEEFKWDKDTYTSSGQTIGQSSTVRLTYNDRGDIRTCIYRTFDACYYQKSEIDISGLKTTDPDVLYKNAVKWVQVRKYGGDCPGNPAGSGYFVLKNSVAETYLRYARDNAIEINEQFFQNTSIIAGLVETVGKVRGNSDAYRQLLGNEITDKLYTYELANPGARFVVACCPVSTISVDQSSWSRLAEAVFAESGLSANSVLITVPYVHTPGIGRDQGTYFFMPGVAVGKEVVFHESSLSRSKYINSRDYAAYEVADKSRLPFTDFVSDVFKYIAKPEIVYSYFLSYQGELVATNRMENPDRITGKDYIYKLIVAEDSRIDKYVSALKEFYGCRNACMSQNPYTGLMSPRITLPSAFESYASSQDRLLNFVRDHPFGRFREVAHGLFDSALFTEDGESGIGKQFAFWYRDHKFSGYCSKIGKETTSSPDSRYFVSGKNAVVYRENLSGLDALGVLLMPFGLDFVTDGAGALYAGYYDDWENVAVYSSALILPVAPAVATKGLASGTKAVIKSGKGLKLVDKSLKVDWSKRMFAYLEIEWKSELDLLTKLKADLSSTPQLFDIFGDELKIEGAYAWRVVNSYAELRKNPEILKAVNNLLSDEKFKSSNLQLELLGDLIWGNRGSGAAALVDLLSGYKTLVSSGTKFENLGAMIAEFNRGVNFAEGERWIQRYILEHPDEFKGRTLTFESRLDAGETVRRVDVVVRMGENSRPVYYEFKSVKNLPPSNFAKQFLKDLEIADNLDQIKWYFDGSKISRLDKEVFLRELE